MRKSGDKMSDFVSKKKRSKIMSKIRSKNTKIEVNFRKLIWKRNFRYRLHYDITGKPDLAFVSKKLCVFIDSCFWHKCPKHFKAPKSNKDYWNKKIKNNVLRDKKIKNLYGKKGWKIIRIWEHELKIR